MKNTKFLILFVLPVSLALMLGFFVSGYISNYINADQKRNVNVSGVALIGGNFTLTDQRGNTVTEKDLEGHWSIVFFGYTSCPDICPPTLQNITLALSQLGQRSNQIVPYFISVDPWRDDQETMAEYSALFHSSLIALWGTPEQIEKVTSAFKVYYSPKSKPQEEFYNVDHSSLVYLMGPDGSYVLHFSHNTTVEDMAARLSELL